VAAGKVVYRKGMCGQSGYGDWARWLQARWLQARW